jgi:NAD(P)H-dependent FMN reductase
MQGIVCISGSNRPENLTSISLEIVVDELRNSGKNPIVFDARTMSLAFPGQPDTEDAQRLRNAVAAAPGVILATPEYHGSFSAMTKLIIENLGYPSVLEGKPVALLGVATGRIGAIKSLEQLKGICSHIGAIVIPGSVSVAGVHKAFDNQGQCIDSDTELLLRGLGHNMIGYLKEYVYPRHVLEKMVRSDDSPWSTNV